MKKAKYALVALMAITGIGTAATTTVARDNQVVYAPDGTTRDLSDRGLTWDCVNSNEQSICYYTDPAHQIPGADAQGKRMVDF